MQKRCFVNNSILACRGSCITCVCRLCCKPYLDSGAHIISTQNGLRARSGCAIYLLYYIILIYIYYIIIYTMKTIPIKQLPNILPPSDLRVATENHWNRCIIQYVCVCVEILTETVEEVYGRRGKETSQRVGSMKCLID